MYDIEITRYERCTIFSIGCRGQWFLREHDNSIYYSGRYIYIYIFIKNIETIYRCTIFFYWISRAMVFEGA